MRYFVASLTFVLFTSALAYTANADQKQIYMENQQGKLVFTDRPQTKTAAKTELPKIGKWNVKELKVRPTCDGHGGMDCSKGADKDGSVICRDGFTGAENPFAFNCTVAELEIVKIDPKPNAGFTVTVRNRNGVEAKSISVTYQKDAESRLEILSGPTLIAPFEIGQYEFSTNDKAPKESELKLSCANCE